MAVSIDEKAASTLKKPEAFKASKDPYEKMRNGRSGTTPAILKAIGVDNANTSEVLTVVERRKPHQPGRNEAQARE
ncbi:hypothetical protein U1Q18_027175 [Sarracenia purpurea var. burkii]